MQGLDFDVDCWLSREEYPMTIHVVLPTANQASVVWVTDRLAGFGLGSALDTEKIRYLRDHKIACSAWGNKAFLIRDEFADRIEKGLIILSGPEAIREVMKRYIWEFVLPNMPQSNARRPESGLILMTFLEERPQTYIASVYGPPVITCVDNRAILGDFETPGKIFYEYYWENASKALHEVLLIGIHIVRLAHEMKRVYIGDPNAWFFKDGVFQQLAARELEGYVKLSKSLDGHILEHIHKAQPI